MENYVVHSPWVFFFNALIFIGDFYLNLLVQAMEKKNCKKHF